MGIKFSINEISLRKSLFGLVRLLGAATWVLTFLAFFLSDIESLAISTWLILLFALWLVGTAISNRGLSNSTQFISLTLILGTPLIFNEANLDTWIPITVLALNLIGIIGFSLYTFWAIPIVFLISGFVKYLIDKQFASFLYGGASFADGWVSIFYLIVVGITSWVVKNYTLTQAQKFDQSMTDRLNLLELNREDQLTRELNATVARRLHESVLNTLNSIQRMRDETNFDSLSLIASRDLESLDEITQQIKPIPLDELVRVAIARCGPVDFQIEIDPRCEVEVSIGTLPGLQHSLTEALRNIDRHAKASKAVIAWYETETEIVMSLSDNGTGFDIEAVRPESYGLRVIANSSLREVGHHVTIESKIGEGTSIFWHFKDLGNQRVPNEEIKDCPRLTQDNVFFRFLFLIIPLFIGTLINYLTQDFADREIVVIQYFLYIFVLYVFATITPSKSRLIFLLPLLLAAIYSGQFNLISQVPDCSAALPIQWIVNGYTVGILLIVVSSIPNILKGIILLSNVVIQGQLSHSLRTCQEIVLLPGITGLVLAIGMMYGLRTLNRQNLMTIDEYQNRLSVTTERELRQQVSDLAFLRMQSLTSDTRILIEELIAHPANLETIQRSARIQESLLRSALQILESTRDDIQEVLLELLNQLARQNVQVSISNWSRVLDGLIWPQRLTQFGYELADSLHDGTCILTFIDNDDEVYFSVEAVGSFQKEITISDFIVSRTGEQLRIETYLPRISYTSEQIVQPR